MATANQYLFVYHRPRLANDYCDALTGKTFLLNATSGLFLAAPRRTGKSTFLREDLVPEMNRRGWETLYVDLWSNKNTDPAELITRAIRTALEKHDGAVRKAARSVGLDRLTVMGALSMDLTKIGQSGGATLAEALQILHDKSGKPIALLIDEAQHALTTEAGTQAMFALKAARDQLNQGGHGMGLYLVMTGSNRDKLTHMVLRKSEPFYGAKISEFPMLDENFVRTYADSLNMQFADGKKFSVDALKRAFDLVGHRPEAFIDVVAETVSRYGGAAGLDAYLASNALRLQDAIWADFESGVNGLTDIQRAVLDTIVRLPPGSELFSDAAIQAYKAALGKDISVSSAQGALDGLRDKGLVWRAGRGNYVLEDPSMRDWYLTKFPG